ncbi:uncharacterized protein [Henckelia pumila]|uniref:uncharacterized protein n=1 Tax=Henckelia pumila TaxID=405737 RepID=UPI003C6E4EDB
MDPAAYHGIGAGYMDPEFRWHLNPYGQTAYPHPHPHSHPHSYLHPHPQVTHEGILREIEKERIREEIIMSEIARRRVLEAEVRMELMMEREMAIWQRGYGFPFGSSPLMGSESSMRPSLMMPKAGWSAEKRLGMALEDKEKLKRSENGGLETLPFQRGTVDLRILEGNKAKERIFLLTKPDENVSGSKTKDVTPTEVVNNELLADVIANKKSKEEWSCALCQVMAASEKDLNGHVIGKKHKSKVAALSAQRTGKNYSIGLFPKKTTKSIQGEEEGVKLKAQYLFSEKAGEATSKKDDFPMSENPKSEDLKKTQAEVIPKVQKNEDDLLKNVQENENNSRKKGYEFWCELCEVGTLSSEVMNAHKLGKKHVSRLKRCEQYGGTGSFNQKKSVVLVDPVEDVSGNGSNINLGKSNQAMDEVSSEDHMLLEVVKHEVRDGKTLDSKPVNIELPADVIASKKSKEERNCAIFHVQEETEGKTSDSEVVHIELPKVVNSELPADVIANKKSEGWSCALCQVFATSVKDLNEHVLGNKHESKVAALRAQTTEKDHSIRLFAKKSNKSIYMVKEAVKLEAQSLFSEKAGEATSKKDDFPLSENPKSEDLKKTQAEVIPKVQKNEDDPLKNVQENENDSRKKGYEFWCELCEVGTLSSKVMNDHKLGKKHVSRLRSCEQYGGTGSFNQNSVVLLDPVEDVSGNGSNINLVKSNQAMDEVSSEDHMLLEVVKHEERDGKTLDSKPVNIELPADVIASKKSKEERSCAIFQVQEEREGKTSDSEVVHIELPEVVNSELPADVIANKKSKEGWSCALCQVFATNVKDLNEHVLGKKHESKVAALRAQTTEKDHSIRLFAKKPTKSIYVVKEAVKLEAQPLFSENAGEATPKKDDLPPLENPKSEHLKTTQAEVIQKVEQNEDDLRMKGCEFWCELCQVGTLSSEVMNAHKLGKKHVSRLKRCEQYGGTGSFNQKKSVVLVDPVEDVSGNGSNINLGKSNQAMDEVSSEDQMLLEVVKHEERDGKTLDSKPVNIELPADVIASKKSKEESSCAIFQVQEEREGKTSDSEVVHIELPEVVNSELPADVIAHKKSKEGWSFALCQVFATNVKDLNEHVLGKKHESKVAALRAQTTEKDHSIRLFAKKPTKSIYVVKEAVKLESQSLFSEKAGEATPKKDDLPLLENPKSEHLKTSPAEVIQKVEQNEDDLRMKGCEFWCELCQVGTLSSEVMNAHKLGKKHVSRLKRCEQYGGTGSFNQKKCVVLVDPVEDVSGNGENINLGKFNEALDEASSEDHALLDAVDHEEREGKTLESEVVDIELPADLIANNKSKEWSCALCQVSATCEKGLNEHVLGKKHKAKEAALRSSEEGRKL